MRGKTTGILWLLLAEAVFGDRGHDGETLQTGGPRPTRNLLFLLFLTFSFVIISHTGGSCRTGVFMDQRVRGSHCNGRAVHFFYPREDHLIAGTIM
jgi:hypothetical protein